MKAHKIWKLGFRKWNDLIDNQQWEFDTFLLVPLNLRALIVNRIQIAIQEGLWPSSSGIIPLHQIFYWNEGKPFSPLPNLPVNSSSLIAKLNDKWDISWSDKQWFYRFKVIWGLSKSSKKAALLWLIAHQAVWTGTRALKIGKGDGICQRCLSCSEDIHHLFYYCPFNLKYFKFLELCFSSLIIKVTPSMVLLGECYHLDILLWHNIRSSLLFCIWKERNSAVFGEGCTSQFFSFLTEVFNLCVQARSKVDDALQKGQTIPQLMQHIKWQAWQRKLERFYTTEKLLMIEGIKGALSGYNEFKIL